MLLEFADRGSLDMAIETRRFYRRGLAALDLVSFAWYHCLVRPSSKAAASAPAVIKVSTRVSGDGSAAMLDARPVSYTLVKAFQGPRLPLVYRPPMLCAPSHTSCFERPTSRLFR
jgi:hypothetical protein